MKKSASLITILILFLLSSCIFFQTINQPSVSLPNDIVTVSIAANTEGGGKGPYFGVCLPIGWTIPGDSLQCNGVYNEAIYYDSLISLEQENVSPAAQGYYWWAGKGVGVSTISGNIYAVLSIQTDNQIGLFSIDYMLGESYYGVNQQRSDDHQIEIVDDEYSPKRLQTSVEGNSVKLNWSEPINTSGLIGYNIYRDEEKINTGIVTDTIFYNANPVEGIHYYTIASYYNNGNEYMMPYDKSLVYQSIYISPNGSNTNNGSSFNDALQTIDYAMSIIRADSLHPITIYLAPGYYSPSTNEEQFPITCLSYVSLVGSDEEVTFLFADDQNVLQFVGAQEITTNGLTITNGSTGIYCSSSNVNFSNVIMSGNAGDGINCINSNPILMNVTLSDNGSGINCDNSNPSFENVTITNNNGGGINCDNSMLILSNVTITNNNGSGINCSNSTLDLANVNITNNNSAENGGGFNCDNSTLNLLNVNITNNSAGTGGGLNCVNNSILNFDSTYRCNIYLNRAVIGNDMSSDALLDVVVDKFTVFNPTVFHTSPIENFTFDILQGVVIQADADLFVSPEGDDTNSGLTENDPLKTIHCAQTKILADSLNPHTINLLDGIYSGSTNGEFFPINILDYVSLSGKSDSSVIINAEGLSPVINVRNIDEILISNLTISGGSGVGIDCWHSNPRIQNVTITNNGDDGIHCEYSNPSLENVTLTNNSSSGIHCEYSNPSLENVAITNNSEGGLSCQFDSSPSLENVTITNNSGRGLSCFMGSSPTLENVIIANNSTLGSGGGIICAYLSNPILRNVLLADNFSNTGEGNGIYCEFDSNPILTNCVLWNDTLPEIYFGEWIDPNSITISYSDIQGGESEIITNGNGTVNWLEGNIDENPLFIVAGLPYTLSSGSPCIDAGNPDAIYNDPEDPNNPGYALWPAMGTLRNDMGAYGGPNAASWIIVGIEDDETEELQIPTEFELAQNYPNPFNPATTIQYSIKERSSVGLVLYDILGRQVVVLVNEEQDAGYYKVNFNAGSLASGIYLYRLQTGSFIETKKMVLLK